MLKITLPNREWYDPSIEEFKYVKGMTLCFEHSLYSISAWEAKWKKPFLDINTPKSNEEMMDYFKCMCITKNVDDDTFKYGLGKNEIDQLNMYINDKMTATWFSKEEERKAGTNRNRIITSELVYYWMIELGIPIEFEKWHFNRLMTLIKVCNIEKAAQNPKGPKMSKKALYNRNAQINAANRAKYHSRG